jgi:hypothetical protein
MYYLVPARQVDEVVRALALTEALSIRDGNVGAEAQLVLGVSANVRRDDAARVRPQRMSVRERLGVRHVNGGAKEATLLDGHVERLEELG